MTVNEKEGLIAFARVGHDEIAENPCDDQDGIGHIYSLGPSGMPTAIPAWSRRNAENPDCVLLSYFEHGLCRWGVRGTMAAMPDFRWDGGLMWPVSGFPTSAFLTPPIPPYATSARKRGSITIP